MKGQEKEKGFFKMEIGASRRAGGQKAGEGGNLNKDRYSSSWCTLKDEHMDGDPRTRENDNENGGVQATDNFEEETKGNREQADEG